MTDFLTGRFRTTLDALADGGWTVRERRPTEVLAPDSTWPAPIRDRYPTIPAALTDFVGRVDACVNPDETAWFLTVADYAGTSDSAYAWNEWERMELESEYANPDDAAEVRRFWDAYLPFYLDVRGEYAYLAVRISESKPVARRRWWHFGEPRELPEPPRGAIVHGEGSDFTGVSVIAGSFDEFLGHLAAAVRDPDGDSPAAFLVG